MVYPPCAVTLPVSVCRTAALALLIKAAAVLISLLRAPYGRRDHSIEQYWKLIVVLGWTLRRHSSAEDSAEDTPAFFVRDAGILFQNGILQDRN